jgi:hypothetical protein
MNAFFRDRLNVAWLVSAIVLAAALILVPNEGVGTVVLIAAAVIAIGLSGKLRIRDARRDRELKAQRAKRRRRK